MKHRGHLPPLSILNKQILKLCQRREMTIVSTSIWRTHKYCQDLQTVSGLQLVIEWCQQWWRLNKWRTGLLGNLFIAAPVHRQFLIIVHIEIFAPDHLMLQSFSITFILKLWSQVRPYSSRQEWPLKDPWLQLRSTSIHRRVDRRLSCVVPGVAAARVSILNTLKKSLSAQSVNNINAPSAATFPHDEPVDLGITGDDAESDHNYWQVLINECGVRWVWSYGCGVGISAVCENNALGRWRVTNSKIKVNEANQKNIKFLSFQ